jgi:hypothetical protein
MSGCGSHAMKQRRGNGRCQTEEGRDGEWLERRLNRSLETYPNVLSLIVLRSITDIKRNKFGDEISDRNPVTYESNALLVCPPSKFKSPISYHFREIELLTAPSSLWDFMNP